MKALVVGKTPMENIQFHRLHSIQITFHVWDWYKTMPGIDQQSTPGESWLVVDNDHRSAEASRSDPHKLKKRLQTAKHSKRIGSPQPDIRC